MTIFVAGLAWGVLVGYVTLRVFYRVVSHYSPWLAVEWLSGWVRCRECDLVGEPHVCPKATLRDRGWRKAKAVMRRKP
ncbi:MAG: hypothetical protein WDA71_13505 [Actinomycetota bacterium]